MTDQRSLTFNDTALRIIDREGQPWITSTDLARALGYSREDNVAQIYRRNAGEFTPSMTAIVRLDQGAQRQIDVVPSSTGHSDTRIFSLRGAHLVAMFAKTPVAAQFRRWVLDVLDVIAVAAPPAPEPPDRLSRFLARHDVIDMEALHDALQMPARREDHLWLMDQMHRRGFYRAWVRVAAVPAGVRDAVGLSFALPRDHGESSGNTVPPAASLPIGDARGEKNP